MPHYSDGTEAKIGDRVMFRIGQKKRDGSGWETVNREGVVFAIVPCDAGCNANVAYADLEIFNPSHGPQVAVVKMATIYLAITGCELSASPA